MLYTATTVKDSTANITRFVERNLAAGADHMLLFLEGSEAAHQARALSGPHVTAIDTERGYWAGERPGNLNARQIANVNLANNLLAPFRWARWLFHIDGDEVLDIDRDYLAGLPAEAHAVRLRPLEAVARDRWPREVTHFKRRLSADELAALHAAGAIARPSNRAYFRGHLLGKTGFRPSPYLAPRIHAVRTHHGAKIEHRSSRRLRVLHFESATRAEFIRKWTALVARGNDAAFRGERRVVADEVRGILESRLPRAEEERRLRRLFDSHARDDLAALDDLGVLVQPDPRLHAHTPAPHTAQQADLLQALLPCLIQADKRYFRPGWRAFHPIDLLRDLADAFRARRTEVVARLHYALTR